MAFAQAKMVERDTGVVVLDLMINNSHYGDYPINGNHNAPEQIASAVLDAKDYGYDGICIT